MNTFWEKITQFHFLSFKFRVETLLFLGVQYRRSSRSVTSLFIIFHYRHVFKNSVKNVKNVRYCDVLQWQNVYTYSVISLHPTPTPSTHADNIVISESYLLPSYERKDAWNMSVGLINLLCSVCDCPCRRFQTEVGLFRLVAWRRRQKRYLKCYGLKDYKDGRCLIHVNYSNISGKKILNILLLTEILHNVSPVHRPLSLHQGTLVSSRSGRLSKNSWLLIHWVHTFCCSQFFVLQNIFTIIRVWY